MSRKDDHYTGIILEDLRDQYKKIIEMLSLMAGVPEKVDRIDKRLERVEADVKVIKAVVTEHSRQLHDHERRITALETT